MMNFLIQTASLAASDVAIYLASIVESATVSCFELLQLIAIYLASIYLASIVMNFCFEL